MLILKLCQLLFYIHEHMKLERVQSCSECSWVAKANVVLFGDAQTRPAPCDWFPRAQIMDLAIYWFMALVALPATEYQWLVL